MSMCAFHQRLTTVTAASPTYWRRLQAVTQAPTTRLVTGSAAAWFVWG